MQYLVLRDLEPADLALKVAARGNNQNRPIPISKRERYLTANGENDPKPRIASTIILHLLISDCPGSIVAPMSFSIFLTNAFRSMSFAAPHALSNIANGSLLIASAIGFRFVL